MIDILITVPTYCEGKNIEKLVADILSQSNRFFVCIVDDNSPDLTNKLLEKILFSYKGRTHIISRSKKSGRGSAVKEGFSWGVSSEYDFKYYVEMDADFSHKPSEIMTGISMLSNAEVVIAARYPHGSITGWPLRRRVFSKTINLILQALVEKDIFDYTNGFRFYTKRAVLKIVNLHAISQGYIFLAECLLVLLHFDFKVASFKTIFENRKQGESKTTVIEILSSLILISKLLWRYKIIGYHRYDLFKNHE